MIVVQRDADLETVRGQINRLGKDMLCSMANSNTDKARDSPDSAGSDPMSSVSFRPLSANWCFLDCEYNRDL